MRLSGCWPLGYLNIHADILPKRKTNTGSYGSPSGGGASLPLILASYPRMEQLPTPPTPVLVVTRGTTQELLRARNPNRKPVTSNCSIRMHHGKEP